MTSSVAASIPGLEEIPSADGMPTVRVKREELESACLALRNAGFSVLIDAIPMDRFPREPRFEISYLLLNPGTDGKPARLRVKVQLPGEDPRCPTLSNVWRAADWAEREAYDFFGIQFDGHPDPRRILMPEDWEGFPLRKDYPVQIKDPVKTYAPLQITEEEFVANIEAARQHTRQE